MQEIWQVIETSELDLAAWKPICWLSGVQVHIQQLADDQTSCVCTCMPMGCKKSEV